ncbi:hypothetical protein F4776DRAFT_134708 [Hypoxylon sp. NC0597]|nr:hypothetical protein F4776DRAFT_134708 [Hypoxylon sp. NC0597]
MADSEDSGSSTERPIYTPEGLAPSEPAADDKCNAPPTDDETTKAQEKGKGIDKTKNLRDLRQPAVGSVTEILGYLPNPVEIFRPGAINPAGLRLPVGNSHCYALTNPKSCLPPPVPWFSQTGSEDEQSRAQAPRDGPRLPPILPSSHSRVPPILPPIHSLVPQILPPIHSRVPPSQQRVRLELENAKEKKKQNIRDESCGPEGSGSQEQKPDQNPDQICVDKEPHTPLPGEVSGPSRMNDETHTPESKSVQQANDQELEYSQIYSPPNFDRDDLPGVTPTRPSSIPLPPSFEDPPSYYATPVETKGLSTQQAGIACLTPGLMTQDPVMQERLQRSMDIREQQQRIIKARQLEARKQYSVLGKDPNNKKGKVLAIESAESESGESQYSQLAQNCRPNQEKQPHWKAKASQKKKKKKSKDKTVQPPLSSEVPAASNAPLVSRMPKGPETSPVTDAQLAQNNTPRANVTSPAALHIVHGMESLTLDETGTRRSR